MRGFRHLSWLLLILAGTAAAGDRIPVLTSLQATFSIASALAQDTHLDVAPIVPPRDRMARQDAYLARSEQTFRPLAESAGAVITIRKVWPGDPLYSYARLWNIHVVEIDGTQPFAPRMAGVAVLSAPGSDSTSPYVWLSPANGVKMAQIIAADFKRLSPADGPKIDANLLQFTRELFALKREFDDRFAHIDNLVVVAMTGEFVYLTDSMNVDVARYFQADEGEWTPADLTAFRDTLKNEQVRVVIHRWEPSAPIKAAIEAAGAKLVILDPLDPGRPRADGAALDSKGYLGGLRDDLEKLAQGFAP